MEKYSLLTKLAKCTLNIALKLTFSVFLFFFVFWLHFRPPRHCLRPFLERQFFTQMTVLSRAPLGGLCAPVNKRSLLLIFISIARTSMCLNVGVFTVLEAIVEKTYAISPPPPFFLSFRCIWWPCSWLVLSRLSLCLSLVVRRGVMGRRKARERDFLPFPFPSSPTPAARVTRRRLGTSQTL